MRNSFNQLLATSVATISVSLLLAVTTQAQITVNVGNFNLQPNTANQQIQLFVSGSAGDQIAGLNFKVQVADGFPDVPSSTINGPNITGIDIIGTVTPTIFFGNNTGQTTPSGGNNPQIAFRSTTTSSGTVTANGLLATLTLDTTGFSSGSFALNLNNVFGGPTQFLLTGGGVASATITDGTLTVVPEPASTALATGLVALGLVAWKRKRG